MTRRHRDGTPETAPQERAIARRRRDLILRVAAEIIADQGPERATFREIAARAGVSKGVVEHHFVNKHDIVLKTLAWVNDRANERERRATRNRHGLAALRARLLNYLPLQPELLREWRIRVHYWSLSLANRSEAMAMNLRFGDSRMRFENDLKDAIALGEIPPATDVARATNMLLHLIAGVSCNRLVGGNRFGRTYQRALVEHLIGQLRAGKL